MTKEEVWAKFCEINPAFKGAENIVLSSERIKKIVETAYKYGQEFGFERGKIMTGELYKAANGNNMGADMFNQIFGSFGKNEQTNNIRG